MPDWAKALIIVLSVPLGVFYLIPGILYTLHERRIVKLLNIARRAADEKRKENNRLL